MLWEYAPNRIVPELRPYHGDISLSNWTKAEDMEAYLAGRLETYPDWLRIVVDFQDRLMVGSDTWVNSQWDRYADIIELNRRWLSKLPRSIAEKIAFRNAEQLFGRKVSMEQVGTK